MIDQYNLFITKEKEYAKSYFNKLHEAYENRNSLYNIIVKYKRYLKFINFPFDTIEGIQNNYKKSNPFELRTIDFGDTAEYKILEANIRRYIVLTYYNIPTLVNKIKFHSLNAIMPKSIFFSIYNEMNIHISSYILLGNKYTFSGRVGAIKIFKYARNFKKKQIDWGETNKARKTNPTAKVYHVDDHYVAAKYIKANSTVLNYKIYNFKFTNFVNTYDRSKLNYYKEVKDLEEVLVDTRIGNIEKMMAIKYVKGINFYS